MIDYSKKVYVVLHGQAYVLKVVEEDEARLRRVLEKRPNLTEFEEECFEKKIKYTMERIK